MTDAQRRWEKQNDALRALDGAIARKRDEQMMYALADPTAWEMEQLKKRRAMLEAELNALADQIGVVRLVPRTRPRQAVLAEVG